MALLSELHRLKGREFVPLNNGRVSPHGRIDVTLLEKKIYRFHGLESVAFWEKAHSPCASLRQS